MSKLTDEVERAAEYVETKIENLAEAIQSIVAKGMSYDLEIRKNGVKVHNMPTTVAGILAGLSFLPPFRLAGLAGLAGATLQGYTFHLRQVTPPKGTGASWLKET
ncbi:MAG: DUF4342 domain-containing protein [Patescibacteria group bacterium]